MVRRRLRTAGVCEWVRCDRCQYLWLRGSRRPHWWARLTAIAYLGPYVPPDDDDYIARWLTPEQFELGWADCVPHLRREGPWESP